MKRSLLACVILLAAGVQAATVPFTILHTNDTHTRLIPAGLDPEWGGAARVATLIEAVRDEGGDVVLLDAGDWSEGTFFHTIAGNGSIDLRLKDMMGYDAVTIGNHDYLYSPGFLVDKLLNEAPGFPLLLANVDCTEYPDLEPLIQPYVMFELSGIKVGVFGVTIDEFIYTQFFDPVEVTDPEDTAEVVIAELRDAGADIVICLSHLGDDGDEDLAESVAGIDIIVGGHSHTRFDEVRTYIDPLGNEVVAVQAGCWYRFLGRLDCEWDTETTVLTVTDYGLLPADGAVAEEQAVKALIDAQAAQIEALFGPVFDDAVAQTDMDLYSWESEMPLGNLVADSVRYGLEDEGYELDAVLVSGNFFADDLPYGIIDTADVLEMYPYGFDPYLGKHLYMLIGQVEGYFLKVAIGLYTSIGLQMHLSGLEVVYNPVTTDYPVFLVNGAPLDEDALYTVAINDVELATIEYFGFELMNQVDTGLECWRLITEYLAMNSPVTPSIASIEGRMRFSGPDLSVPREDILFEPAEPAAGQVVRIRMPVMNYGETAAAGATIELYRERTPDIYWDDAAYGEDTLVGRMDLADYMPAFGAGPTWVDFFWSSQGTQPGERHRFYVKLRDVVDAEDNAEWNTRNNRIPTRSDGLLMGDGAFTTGVELVMPADFYTPGDPCYLTAIISNGGALISNGIVVVVLEVFGEYYFAPSWVRYAPPESTGFDNYQLDLPPGQIAMQVLPRFIWPDTGADALSGLVFYGGILTAELDDLVGALGQVSFGFGPTRF
ncbi:bifunctional metallophosphatase/5'-nucleotidase [bacterium]|nr:bifunctional metallophosphatase/5'-nucleotidase [candidate division CSSED10-310 bacterium]